MNFANSMTASPDTAMATVPADKSGRNGALDFTKGALVLFMVLYHWLNYFISADGDFFRYLRFVTPSFIFITGFLISSVYLSKYQVSDPRLPKRLVQRGLKILGVFIFLNLTISFLLSESYSEKIIFGRFSARDLIAIFLTGNTTISGSGKAAAFYILVPISYLLLLSAVVSIACRYFTYSFHFVCIFFLSCIFVFGLNGLDSPTLDLVTIGILGVICGYVPIDRINGFVRHPYLLIVAYLCYTGAIYIWNVIYPLQVVGVFLSLTLIYLIGVSDSTSGIIRKYILLLGRYSLFAYIAQIAILQLMFRSLRHIGTGASVLLLSFFAAFALTVAAVVAVDRARTKASTVDRLYKTVFS